MATNEEKISMFREMFPEFKNIDIYPDSIVLMKINIAEKLVAKGAWGDMHAYGVGLLTAHLLVLTDKALSGDGSVNANGDALAVSKSVGGVSVSYATPAGFNSENSFASTSYGRLYLNFANIFGVGCIQL